MKRILPPGRSRSIPGAVALVLTAVAVGCHDQGPSISIQPVSGKVLLADGRPLRSGTIHFEPVDAPAMMATGTIQPDGTFRMTTRVEGDGVVEGECRVFVVPDRSAWVRAGAPLFPIEYTDPDSSCLMLSVEPGRDRLEPIVLRPKSAARP